MVFVASIVKSAFPKLQCDAKEPHHRHMPSDRSCVHSFFLRYRAVIGVVVVAWKCECFTPLQKYELFEKPPDSHALGSQ